MKKLAHGLACFAVAVSAHAQDDKQLFVTVDSASTMSQGAAMVLAGQAIEQKASVRVLLCGAGGDLAVQGQAGETLKPKNVTPQDMLKGLIKSGATVEVCALFLPNKGLKPEALVAGVKPAKPAEVAAHILKPGVKVLSF